MQSFLGNDFTNQRLACEYDLAAAIIVRDFRNHNNYSLNLETPHIAWCVSSRHSEQYTPARTSQQNTQMPGFH